MCIIYSFHCLKYASTVQCKTFFFPELLRFSRIVECVLKSEPVKADSIYNVLGNFCKWVQVRGFGTVMLCCIVESPTHRDVHHLFPRLGKRWPTTKMTKVDTLHPDWPLLKTEERMMGLEFHLFLTFWSFNVSCRDVKISKIHF